MAVSVLVTVSVSVSIGFNVDCWKVWQVLDSPNKPGKFREIVKVLFSRERERRRQGMLKRDRERGRDSSPCFSDSYLVQGFAR